MDEVLELLEEAVDWLCPHNEAVSAWRTQKVGRAWCCDCHNYIRSEADATLIDRCRAILKKRSSK